MVLYEDVIKRLVKALVAAMRALQVTGGGGRMRRGGKRELRPGKRAAAVEGGRGAGPRKGGERELRAAR